VYRARQRVLNRLVAVKVIRRDRAANPQSLARFRREAEAIARLTHPHIIAVYSWGEHGGTPYFALEYCPGGSLRDRLAGQPQAPAEAARLVEKLARAVQAGHDRGIVHRDLKPANVLLAPAADEAALNTAWGVPKVTDFGLCRLFEDDVARTAEGVIAGSPRYMAPEQAEGRAGDIGPAADIWALGAILYELLTGRPPFTGDSMPSILYSVCYDEPPRPSQVRSEVPASLEAICLKCLSKQPGERYARAADLAEALRRWLAHAPADTAGAPGTQLETVTLAPGWRPPPLDKAVFNKGRKNDRRLWVAAVLLLAGLLGLGSWAVRVRPTPTTPPIRAGSVSDGGPSQASGGQTPEGNALQSKPLAIDLRVFRCDREAFNIDIVGELGQDTFRVRFNEPVTVQAVLSEPAYAYLIAFNPADKPDQLEQIVPLAEGNTPPIRRDRLGSTGRLLLNDGEGLQVFAVVASRQELPAYSQWRKQGPLPWKRTPATVGMVWRADGAEVTNVLDPRFVRAEEKDRVDDRTMIRALAEALQGLPGVEAVSVLGFAVDRAD
jgi:tRNA A-37 threonylcarbamoyl transferase component Bud32